MAEMVMQGHKDFIFIYDEIKPVTVCPCEKATTPVHSTPASKVHLPHVMDF